jgi:hypothetical protein
MNAMGHNVPNLIGVSQKDLVKRINQLVPGYMAMGDSGMHDMAEMSMDIPDNTLPMMTGDGPFGAIGMGGMFTVLKVRKDQPPAGHPQGWADPGWYGQPQGSGARFWQEGDAMPPEASRHSEAVSPQAPATTVLTVRKPGDHGGHGDH